MERYKQFLTEQKIKPAKISGTFTNHPKYNEAKKHMTSVWTKLGEVEKHLRTMLAVLSTEMEGADYKKKEKELTNLGDIHTLIANIQRNKIL